MASQSRCCCCLCLAASSVMQCSTVGISAGFRSQLRWKGLSLSMKLMYKSNPALHCPEGSLGGRNCGCGLMFDLCEGTDRHGNISKCTLLSMHAEEPGVIQRGSFLAIDPTAGSQQKNKSRLISCCLLGPDTGQAMLQSKIRNKNSYGHLWKEWIIIS